MFCAGGGPARLPAADRALRGEVPPPGREAREGAELHEDLQHGREGAGAQARGPHPVAHRVLPHEHPHHSAHHLPHAPRGVSAEPGGAHRGRLQPVAPGAAVRPGPGAIHQGPEHRGAPGVDVLAQAHHTDGLRSGRSSGALEGAQRDRRWHLRRNDL